MTENMDPSKKLSAEDRKLAEAAYGLDKPWYEAYFYWLGKVVTGDLGNSFRERRPVAGVIGQRMGPTLLLSGLSLLLTYVISVPIGLYATVRANRLDERASSGFLYALNSLPSYVTALQLLQIFYLGMRDTPWQLKPGMMSDDYETLSSIGKVQDISWHLLLPWSA